MRTGHHLSAVAFLLGTAPIVAATSCTNTIVGQPVDAGGSAAVTGGSGGTGAEATGGGGGTGAEATGGSAGSETGGTAPTIASDLPCDVQNLLGPHCVICHEESPPGRLLTHADLAAPSATDPGHSVAQEALVRMRSTAMDHMPPSPMPPPSAAAITAFATWLESGASVSSCSGPPIVGPDPYDTPVVCTSGTHWTGGDEESPLMHPGGACVDCHTTEDEGPRLVVAGTLYPTPHEPTDCNGVASSTGAVVIVTDANGTEHRLTPNSAGNFFYEGAAFPFPYSAKVSYNGRERVMVEAQDDGDCNFCHTEAGASRAPGRIFLP